MLFSARSVPSENSILNSLFHFVSSFSQPVKIICDKANPNASKIIRDKAYTYMKALVDEIREAGKYVFRNDKNRLKGYSSEYWRKLHRKQSNNQEEVA
jgi:hypothetical protein